MEVVVHMVSNVQSVHIYLMVFLKFVIYIK